MNIDHLIRIEIFLANVEATLKLNISSDEKIKIITQRLNEFKESTK